jgi:S-layer homology domain
MGRGQRSWGVTAAVVMSAGALFISLTGAARAGGGDLFDDIAGSPFRTEINRIARAGCAAGFADGSFRGRDSVTRQQFAFWTNNCGARVAADGNSGVAIGPTDTAITSVQLQAGATDSGLADGGFVMVTGSIDARVNTEGGLADCPCDVQAWVEDGTTSSGFRTATIGNVANDDGGSSVSLTVTDVFPIGPEQTKEFTLTAQYIDSSELTIFGSGDLTAVYVPFGADGDRALDIEP